MGVAVEGRWRVYEGLTSIISLLCSVPVPACEEVVPARACLLRFGTVGLRGSALGMALASDIA